MASSNAYVPKEQYGLDEAAVDAYKYVTGLFKDDSVAPLEGPAGSTAPSYTGSIETDPSIWDNVMATIAGVAENQYKTNDDSLDVLMDKMEGGITGEYDYNVYAKKIKGLNKRLKKAKLPLEVDLISQNNFEDLLSMHSWDLIKCDVGYEDLDPSEALMDYYSYNQSYEQWRK